MNYGAMTPQPALASTAHVLANTDTSAAEFLVYAPNGGTARRRIAAKRGYEFLFAPFARAARDAAARKGA
jgi:hypothetical protein